MLNHGVAAGGRARAPVLWRGQPLNGQECLGSRTVNCDAPLTIGYQLPSLLALSVWLIL